MSSEFNNSQFNAAIELINDSWHVKADLAAAPSIQTFDLSGVQEQQLQIVPTVTGNRLVFPSTLVAQRVSFAADKLFLGICAGDFTDDKNQDVQVYYPHERDNKLTGKTVFTMKIDDARNLARVCYEALGVPKDLFADAIRGKRANAYYGDSFQVHEHDIIDSLI